MKKPKLLLLVALAVTTPGFAKDDEGKIVSVSKDAITIGKKHPSSYKITATTLITVNGQPVMSALLRPGMRAEVTARGGVAASVDAVEEPLKGGSLKVPSLKKK